MPVRPPRGNHAKNVRLSIRVYDDQQVADVTQAQGHESWLVVGIGVFSSQREIVVQDRDRFDKANTMGTQIRLGLPRVPFEPHTSSV